MPNDITTAIRPVDPESMVPLAIISDIHANLPALQAVMDDIAQRGIERIICLGDVIGYGPDPAECWRLVSEKCEFTILGNHDYALSSGDMSRFHPRARKAIVWTHKKLLTEPDGADIIQAIRTLPRTVSDGEHLFVHGCPTDPTMEYLLPGDSFDVKRMHREFALVDHFAFNGHSHIPGVIQRGMRFLPPEAMTRYAYPLKGKQAIINVGSVGQPRDGNPKSCYVTIEDGELCYRRVEYDVENTCQRITAISELDPFLGQRLLVGY